MRTPWLRHPSPGQLRPRLRPPVAAIAVITASLCGSLLHAAPARAATAPTVVTIGFDDGTAEQVDALPILQAHGMKATFFVNTGVIGDAEHLSWADLHTLFNAGNEIAGHTVDHANLAPLTTAEARQEVAPTATACSPRDSRRPRSRIRSAPSTAAPNRSSRRAVTTAAAASPASPRTAPMPRPSRRWIPMRHARLPTPRRRPSSPPSNCTSRTPRPTVVAGSSSSSTACASSAAPMPSPQASSPRCWTSSRARWPPAASRSRPPPRSSAALCSRQ